MFCPQNRKKQISSNPQNMADTNRLHNRHKSLTQQTGTSRVGKTLLLKSKNNRQCFALKTVKNKSVLIHKIWLTRIGYTTDTNHLHSTQEHLDWGKHYS